MVKISVVVVALNEEEYLPELLDSIKRQHYDDYEVIVSDANSTDNTRDIAREYGAKVVSSERRGPGHGRNVGAEEADGDILLFLDADVKLTGPNVFDNIHDAMSGTENVIGTSTAIIRGDTLRGKIFFKLGSIYVGIFNRLGFYVMAPGNFQFVKKEVFDKIGGFDEELPFCEDDDMVARAMEHGGLSTLTKQYYMSSRRVDEKGLISTMMDYYPPQIYRMLGMEDKMKEKHSFETAGASEQSP